MAKETPRRILDAALACFTAQGFEATTVADICARAAVSNGSLFHHFGSKEGIAEALFLAGLEDYQDGLLAVLRRHDTQAQAAIMAAVRFHLEWVERHRELARFLFDRGRPEWSGARLEKINALNARFGAELARVLGPWQADGTLKPLSPDLFGAVLIGPAQVVARAWITGQRDTAPSEAARTLGAAAWAALAAP